MDSGENLLFSRTLLLGIFFGGIILVLMYILKLFNSEEKAEDNKKNEKVTQHSEKKKESASSKSKKKATENKWSTKADKQGFTHPWLVKSLKGHTGEVLDMNFSSNNKYLISCGDEDPGGSTEGGSDSSNKENSRPPSVEPSPKVKRLSRRQRKNRRKEDNSPEVKKKTKKKTEAPENKKEPLQPLLPLKIWTKLKMDEAELFKRLEKYTLSQSDLMSMGYPIITDSSSGSVLVYKNEHRVKSKVGVTKFDVNAEEFVPKARVKTISSDEYDSGQGSGNSSDTGENTDEIESNYNVDDTWHNYTHARQSQQIIVPRGMNQIEINMVHSNVVSIVIDCPASSYWHLDVKCQTTFKYWNPSPENVSRVIRINKYPKICVRCGTDFVISDHGYVTQQSCKYHWGKLQNIYSQTTVKYTCCNRLSGSIGCMYSGYHVWNGVDPGPNYLTGYVQTKFKRYAPADGNYGVYALDCEMSYTFRGLELTKVTVVRADGRKVYDTFVKPDTEIVDYNTKFSGVTKDDLINAKSLRDVQNDLMGFINAESIIIGHAVDNDLRALKMVHSKVVDTSYVFPHQLGLPYRRSLKQLAKIILKKTIQGGQHSSYEDALTSLELMLVLLKKEPNQC